MQLVRDKHRARSSATDKNGDRHGTGPPPQVPRGTRLAKRADQLELQRGTPVIPAFNQSGVLPPFLPEQSPAQSAAMAPYLASMVELAATLTSSPERVAILNGFLDFRQNLRAAGFNEGFQWVAGSYLEDCERQRGRPPQDVDIVTFARRPASYEDDGNWREFVAHNPGLFSPSIVKESHRCDAFFVDLTLPQEAIVSQTRYWFGLFSHQRSTYLWKGILAVDLQDDDLGARALLSGGS